MILPTFFKEHMYANINRKNASPFWFLSSSGEFRNFLPRKHTTNRFLALYSNDSCVNLSFGLGVIFSADIQTQ